MMNTTENSNTTKMQIIVSNLKRYFVRFSVQRPILSMTLLVLGCVTILPVITAAALMPISLLLTYTGLLASEGLFYIIYNVVIQGLLLATIIVGLFVVGFSIATSFSVFHSYKFFKNVQKVKNN